MHCARSCKAKCNPAGHVPGSNAEENTCVMRGAVAEARGPTRKKRAKAGRRRLQPPPPGFCFEDAKRALHVFTHTAPRMSPIHSCNADRLHDTARHIFPGPFSTAGSPAGGPCPLLYRAGKMLYNVVARRGTIAAVYEVKSHMQGAEAPTSGPALRFLRLEFIIGYLCQKSKRFVEF